MKEKQWNNRDFDIFSLTFCQERESELEVKADQKDLALTYCQKGELEVKAD